ncbi:MAG: glycosyltransferase [Desulfurococcaceae archaeon]
MRAIMFTFESTYVKKVGGLAEVPPRLGEAMEKLGLNIELFTPSHSVIDTCIEPVFEVSINDVNYCVSKLSNLKPIHYVVGGGVLDEPSVYPPGKLMEKSLMFARVIYEYFKEKLTGEKAEFIFHGHDWHSIPVLLALNALSVKKDLNSRFVLHVHLGTRNAVSLDELCRIALLCEETYVRGDHGIAELKHYYYASGGIIERLAALTVDKIVTVSRNYVKNLVRLMGPDKLSKMDYVYNASPLTWDEVVKLLKSKFGLVEPGNHVNRLMFRDKLLTNTIKFIGVSYIEQDVEKYVKSLIAKYDLEYNSTFKSSGPLIFMIGRLSSQKGFDYVLKALDKIVFMEPRVKLVVAFSPTTWDLEAVKAWIEAVLSFPDNLRVFPGMLSRDHAVLFYYASNATLIPSRNEPFGLVALESMATGTPVSASKVGGLADIVLDVRREAQNGVGVLFTPGNIDDLVDSTMHLVELMEKGYEGAREALAIRASCIKRAEEFDWGSSARKTIDLYNEILKRTWIKRY